MSRFSRCHAVIERHQRCGGILLQLAVASPAVWRSCGCEAKRCAGNRGCCRVELQNVSADHDGGTRQGGERT